MSKTNYYSISGFAAEKRIGITSLRRMVLAAATQTTVFGFADDHFVKKYPNYQIIKLISNSSRNDYIIVGEELF